MSHLLSFRKGWENENMARYILSRFCFIANPSTVSDDIGSDYFCTLFKIQKDGKNKFLIPQNFFAIQIKSNKRKIDATKKIKYLANLEIPYFVGVINQKNLKLTIYSGEYIPFLFTYRTPKKLEINLCKRDQMKNQFSKLENDSYTINFPLIVEIKADIDEDNIKVIAENLSGICSLMQSNISSRVNCEYIFHEYLTEQVYIRAGKDSAKTFRDNFLKRLAENFYNLYWIYNNHPDNFKLQEFKTYENLLSQLKNIYRVIPEYVLDPYSKLKTILEKQNKKN